MTSPQFSPYDYQIHAETSITSLTKWYLDEALTGAGPSPGPGREFDFVADFAGLLPMDVISDLIGVPEPDTAELALKSHPAVFDVVVAGVPDERFGQRVAAVVRLRAGETGVDGDALRGVTRP